MRRDKPLFVAANYTHAARLAAHLRELATNVISQAKHGNCIAQLKRLLIHGHL